MLCRNFAALVLLGLLAGCGTAAPPRPHPVPLDHDASDQPVSGPELVYPATFLVQRREGVVTVECTVLTDGTTKNCSVIAGSDEGEFRQASLDYVGHSKYTPATRKGVVSESTRRWTLVFGLLPVSADHHDPFLPIGALPPRPVTGAVVIYPPLMLLAGREGIAEAECVIAIDGKAKDCRLTNGAGGVLFYYAALDHARWSRFAPALLDGVPIEVKHRWTIAFRLNPSGPVAPALPPVALSMTLPVPLLLDTNNTRWPVGDPSNPSHAGTAQVSCLVTVQGTAKDCTIVAGSGDVAADLAVQHLAERLRFGPALQDGAPVEARGAWKVIFNPDYAFVVDSRQELG